MHPTSPSSTHSHACAPTCLHTHTPTRTHAHMHTRTHAHTHTSTPFLRLPTRTHTRRHTHIPAPTHTYLTQNTHDSRCQQSASAVEPWPASALLPNSTILSGVHIRTCSNWLLYDPWCSAFGQDWLLRAGLSRVHVRTDKPAFAAMYVCECLGVCACACVCYGDVLAMISTSVYAKPRPDISLLDVRNVLILLNSQCEHSENGPCSD